MLFYEFKYSLRMKKLPAFLYTEGVFFGYVCLGIPLSVWRGGEEQ